MESTESDDSERWEDFYGSSTELAPALLDIYDALNTALEAKFGSSSTNNNNNSSSNSTTINNTNRSTITPSTATTNTSTSTAINKYKNQNESPANILYQHSYSLLENSIDFGLPEENYFPKNNIAEAFNTTLIKAKFNNHQQSLSASTAPLFRSLYRNQNQTNSTTMKHRGNICLLSPNVQRIITHSDAEDVVDTMDLSQTEDKSNNKTPSKQHFNKKLSTPPPPLTTVSISKNSTHRGKLSNIPLSKTTGKLTLSGNDLVSTFDSSCEYLDAIAFSSNEKMPTNSNHSNRSNHSLVYTTDEEKTPTNNDDDEEETFKFDLRINHDEHPDLYASSPNVSSSEIENPVMEIEKLAATTQLLSRISLKPKIEEETIESQDEKISSTLEEIKLDFGKKYEDDEEDKEIAEAINLTLVENLKSNQDNSSLKVPDTSESLNSSSPLRQQESSTESLNRPANQIKSNSMPRVPQKISMAILPDVAKLKHRPLSSSSLCSTSSTSSSGSDSLNSKLNTSYLASIESLADNSEPELVELRAGMTVLDRACLEIIDSERNYVEDLRQVITGYLSDWKKNASLSVDELSVLFSNIEEIYEFSLSLLKQLVEAGLDPVKIARCFIAMREGFDVYTKYCTSYPEAISLLTKLLQTTYTNNLLSSTQRMLHHTLPLGSYLLKPVQRILKYHLLLDNLRKHCDLKEIFQSHEIMRQVARHIDQVKRRLEQQNRVKELCGIIDGWLGPELTVLGELRLEGLLMDHNKPRMVFLFATMLIITKPKEDNRLIFKSYIHQNNLMLSEHLPGEPTSFYVIPYDDPRNQIKLTAKSRDQKRVWTQHIKEAMLEKFDNIPSRAKELVYKLGDEEDRSPGKNTRKWVINSPSMTPVYLERRNQYRRSELRTRSKLKRKTLVDINLHEVTNEERETEKLPANKGLEDPKALKPKVIRKNSFDDSMIPILFRLAGVGRPKLNHLSMEKETGDEKNSCKTHEENSTCTCILQDQRKKSLAGGGGGGGLTTKNRSKSVINVNVSEFNNNHEEKVDQDQIQTTFSTNAVEIKQYNHKTLPKRVANLKKQKINNNRNTFKFYMDISEFEQKGEENVLKITESTENLVEDTKKLIVEEEESPPPLEIKSLVQAKKDADIVLDLLRESKEFERAYKKAPRKKSTEALKFQKETKSFPAPLTSPPPPPPSTSPPLLENDATTKEKPKTNEEPIYETLRRNVHVPYRFSPDFKRSKSLQAPKKREKKVENETPRPESDYVTLKYSQEGILELINSEPVPKKESKQTFSQIAEAPDDLTEKSENQELINGSTSTLLAMTSSTTSSASSTSTLLSPSNQNSATQSTCDSSNPTKPKNLIRRFLTVNNANRILSLDNISNVTSSRHNRRKSSEHMPGLHHNKPPERRASDVTEMCRQSILHRQGSEAVGERMAFLDYADPRTLFASHASSSLNHLQRDSAFSLTSSSDSVYGAHNRAAKNSSSELSTNFEYEEDVEANLEQDFRDSAIYSDDNEKNVYKQEQETLPSHLPPKLPPKPPRIKETPVINSPASKSWVLQQIENFSKQSNPN